MQTDAVATRITTAAHLTNAQVARPSIIVRDWRIRSWTRAQTGGLTYANVFAICTNASGEVVRVRTLSDGTLDIRYATIATTLTWSANTVVITSDAGYGVTLNGNGTDNLECYYIHSDGLTVKRITSTDGGHTWAAATTVTTLAAQSSVIYLASPTANMVWIGDGSSGLTTIKVAIYSGGAWAVTSWDLGSVSMTSQVNVYGVGLYAVPFDVISIGTNDYILAFYAQSPRGYQNNGIYYIRVSNLGAGLTPYWQQIQSLFATNPGLAQTGTISYPALYIAFPQLQQIGSEYWLTACEISGYVNNNVQTFVVFRSNDGVHWSDRGEKFYSVSNGLTYSPSSTAFTFTDFVHGQCLISGTNLYLFGFDKVFYAPATQLCGVDNADKKLDVSADVIQWSASLPNGSAGTFGFTLDNRASTYNGSAILRRGAQVVVQSGYYTTSGEERINTITGLIDEIRQSTSLSGKELINSIEVVCRDYTKKLQEDGWVPDIFYEYASPDSTHLTQFSDTTSLSVFNGTFFAEGGELHGGMLDSTSTLVDNLATLAYPKGADGVIEIQFKCTGAWANSYVGIAFQVANNTEYHAITYDGTNFSLYKATPNATGASKIFSYALVDNIGGQTRQTAVGLTVGTAYWLRVQQWHNRVVASYSTDRQTWTEVIDYAPVPSAITYWGIILKGSVSVSAKFGVPYQPDDAGLDLSYYYVPLNDLNASNIGKAMSYFLRVQTAQAGILRSVTLYIDRGESRADYLQYVPDTTIQVWRDYGDGSKPADLTNPANKLFETSLDATAVPLQLNRRITPTSVVVNDETAAVTANTYYWICVKAAGNISSTGGIWGLAATPNALLYMPSSYGTGFKCKFQYNPSDLATFYPASGEFNPADIVAGDITHPGGAGSVFSMYMQTSYDSAGIVVQAANHLGGEPHKTIDHICADVVQKAGITSQSLDSWINDTFGSFDVGADGAANNWANNYTGTWAVSGGTLQGYTASGNGYLRTNTYLGNRGDGVITANMTFLAGSGLSGFLLRASGDPSSFTGAYLLAIYPGTPSDARLYKVVSGSATLLYAVPTLHQIPTNQSLRVTVVALSGLIALYINDCLEAVFWDATLVSQGAVGVFVNGNSGGGALVTFDNFRVPGAWKIKKYFAVQARESGKTALDRLLSKDRYGYFLQADGTFKLSTFLHRSSVDSYGATVITTRRVDSDRYWVSHIQPQGDRFADRFDATLMDSEGRRFKSEDYADAFTDEQAYDDATIPLRKARELTLQYSLESNAVPAVEREDVITAVNALDGTNTDFVVNDVSFSFRISSTPGEGSLEFNQTLGLRTFVS